MSMLEIDRVANNGPHCIKRRVVSSNPLIKKMIEGLELINKPDCMELCEILRLKLTGYIDKLNLHIMNDNSGVLIGCICR